MLRSCIEVMFTLNCIKCCVCSAVCDVIMFDAVNMTFLSEMVLGGTETNCLLI